MKLLIDSSRHLGRFLRSPRLTFLLRIGLGIVFLVAGFSKLAQSGEFVVVVVERRILPDFLAEFYGSILPWVEVVIGSLLICGILRKLASIISLLVILSFIIANTFTIYKGFDADCACFGDVWIMHGRDALFVDLLMFLAAFQIFLQKIEFLSTNSWRLGKHKTAAG